jgi:hypothetical protein
LLRYRPAMRPSSTLLRSAAFAVAIVAAACASEPEAPLQLPLRQTQWALHPGNPVIKAGDFREQGLWNDPSVLKVGSEYVMYLTSSTREPFKPPVLPFRAVSADGISWRLDPANPLFDEKGTPFVSVETPSVVYFRGEYHLYYSGIHPSGHVPMMEIGHAVSADGIHWKKDPAPVIRSSGKPAEWNGFLVGEPGAVVYKDRIHVYFTAMGARPSGTPPQLQSIGLAISKDGRTFEPPRVALSQTSLYGPEKGFPGYSTPAALVDGETVHLFYDVVHFDKNARPEWRQVALQHAVSRDGGLTFREVGGPLVRRDDNDWSTAGEVRAPAALIDGNQVKVWFGGHVGHAKLGDMIRRGFRGREFGIGLMTTDLANLRAAAK